MKKSSSINIVDLAIAGFCAAVLLFSVRSNSIWIDEGQTYSVIHGNWQHMLRAVFGRGDAVSGMPLYFVAEFAWCSLFGYSEYAMRSMNLIFAALALWGGCRILRAFRLPLWTLPLFAVNSVFLYYMNEARPYAAIYTCGLWCFYFLFGNQEEMRKRDVIGFAVCFLIGCALHMMFVFMGVSYICRALLLYRRGKLGIREHVLAWLAVMPLFVLLAIHYLNFSFNAPEVRSQYAAPLSSVAQIGYYFAGLGGLGFSRNALRGMDMAPTPRICIGLAAAAIAYVALFAYFVKFKLFKVRILATVCVCAALSMACFVSVNIMMKTRFWERHVIYLVPFICFIVAAVGAEVVSRCGTLSARALVALVLAVQAVSGLNIVAMGYYQKDDHKEAARLALSLKPDHIFFQGDATTFGYYGIKGRRAENVRDAGEAVQNVNISNIKPASLEELIGKAPGRTVLILNEKPEFDANKIYRKMGKDGIAVNSFAIVHLQPRDRGRPNGKR